MIRIAILGPLAIRVDDANVVVSGAIRRALLARLAIDAGNVVSVDRLIDDLWGDDAPRTAVGTIQTYMSQLRKHFGNALVTRSPGYALELDHDGLDAARFESALADHRYREALGLWTGDPLGEFDAAWARAEAARLGELHLEALEGQAEERLERGDLASLVPELETQIAAHPLRERLWAFLVTALYRAGRQAEALRAYQRLSDTLREELGIEPSAELRDLERAVLNQSLEGGRAASDLPSGVVTFVLTDIEGSTALWDTDARAMAEALERHDTLIAGAVERSGGVLIKSKGEGDATFNVFTRATDAVTAAIAIQDAIGATDWPTSTALRVRIALVTGEAVERRGDYYGTTVNRAARLRALASGGEILIGESSVAVVRDHLPAEIELTEVGARDLSGLSRPEQVWVIGDRGERVVGSATISDEAGDHETHGHERVLPAALATRPGELLVGRAPEIEGLRGAFGEAVGGKRRAVFLAGEPGIGKTRLAAAVARSAHQDGALVVFGRCDEGLGAPHQPFAEAMRAIVTGAEVEVLRSHVAACGGELARLVPELSGRIPTLPAPIDAEVETAQLRLYEAVLDLLRRTAERQPVVVVLDDLHWAASSTVALTRHLLLAEDVGAVLVLATYRDTEVDRGHSLGGLLTALHSIDGAERMALRGLDAPAIESLLTAAGGQDLDDDGRDLAAALVDRTAGNPFFANQVLGHLVEAGGLVQRDGRWVAGPTFSERNLPEGVVDVVGRRLDRLAATTNQAITVAAVIGLDFSLALLEQIPEAAGDAESLLDALDAAVQSRLLTETAPGRYGFAHAIVREVLLREVTGARRARLHRSVGRALEALQGTEPGPHLNDLSHHYTEASALGDVRTAARWATAAADWALDHADPQGAITVLERALAAVDAVEPLDHEARYDVTASLASAFNLLFLPESRDWALAAAASARHLGDPKRLLRASSWVASQWGTYDDEMRQLLQEAARGLDDPSPELAWARSRLAAADAIQTLRSPLAASASALAMAEQFASEAPALLALVRNARAALLQGTPLASERLELLEAVLATSPEVLAAEPMARHLGLQGSPFGLSATARLTLGDRDGFDADLSAQARDAERTGSRGTKGYAAGCRATVSLMDGRFGDVADQVAAYTADFPAEPNFALLSIAHLATRDYEIGLVDEGRMAMEATVVANPRLDVVAASLARVQATSEATAAAAASTLDSLLPGPDGPLWTLGRNMTLCYRAEAAARIGHVATAADVLPRLDEFAGLVAILPPTICVWGAYDRGRGLALLTLGRFDEAVVALEAAIALEEQIRSVPLVARSRYWLARTLAARSGEGDRERAAVEVEGSVAVAERLGMAELAASGRALLFTLDEVAIPRALFTAGGSLMGRHAEVDRLDAAISSADDVGRRLVLVTGEPGIGKTRLVAEACGRAHADGHTVLFGHCDEGLGAPYQPFSEALRDLAGAMRPGRLGAIAGPASVALSALVPDMAPDGTRRPETEPWVICDAYDSFLTSLAEHRPVVLVLDDLHWSDSSSLQLLRHLVGSTRSGRVTIVATYRDTDLDRSHPLADALSELRRSPQVERISLGGLDVEATADLVDAIAPDVNEEFSTRVFAETQGNPFFVREVVQHALDTDSTDDVPEGVRQVIGRRLSRLPDDTNEVLRAGAIMGRSFDTAVLGTAGAAGDTREADASLEAAVGAGLLVELPGSLGRYEFAHALIRQTLYAESTTNRRVRLHWQIAEAMASLRPDEVDAIAHHRIEGVLAGDPAIAVDACFDAAGAAWNSGAQDGFRHYLGTATDLLDQHDLSDPERRFEASFGLARAFGLAVGDDSMSDRLDAFLRAADIAESNGLVEQLADAVVVLSSLANIDADQRVIALQDRTLDALDANGATGATGATGEQHALLLAAKAGALFLRGDPTTGVTLFARAEAAFLEAQSHGSVAGRPWREPSDVKMSALRYTLLLGSPAIDDIEATAEEIFSFANRRILGSWNVWGAMCGVHIARGRRAAFDAQRQLMAESSDTLPFTVAWLLASWPALIALVEGRFDDAVAAAKSAPKVAGSANDLISRGQATIARIEQGRVESIADGLRDLTSAVPYLTPWRAQLALVECELGHLEEAAATVDELARNDFEPVAHSPFRPLAWRCLAETVAVLGDADHARGLEPFIRPYSGQLLVASFSSMFCLGAADRSLAQILAVQGRLDEALELYESGLALEEGFGAPALAARTRYWFACALLDRHDDGDRALAAELLASSLAFTDQMGMHLLHEQAAVLASRATVGEDEQVAPTDRSRLGA